MTTHRHGRSPGTLRIIISTEVGGVASKIARTFSRIFPVHDGRERPVTCNVSKDRTYDDV
jgi:hypothetical protein